MVSKISQKTFNDYHIALAFTVLFTAYNGHSHIQKTLSVSIHEDNPEYYADGFVNFGIIYTFFLLGLWLAPPAIAMIGCKISLVLGSLFYLSFVTFNYFENTWTTYAAGAITGLGAALLWTSQATYCVLNSEIGSVYKSVSIFWIFCEASEFSGNLIVYCLFKDPNQPLDRSLRHKISIVLSGFVLCSTFMFICLRQPLRPQEKDSKNAAVCSEIKKSLKLLISKNMLLSSVIFMFAGLNLCFLNVLPASLGFSTYLSTNSKEYAPLSGLMHGSGEIIGAFLALYMNGKSILKLRLIPITCIYAIVAYIITYLGLPNTSVYTYTDEKPIIEMPIYIFLIANNFVGMADACLHIEAYNFIGNLYPVDCAAPFAVFKFIRNIAVASSSYYSNILGLQIQMIILIVFSLLSFIVYYWSWEDCSLDHMKTKEESKNCVTVIP